MFQSGFGALRRRAAASMTSAAPDEGRVILKAVARRRQLAQRGNSRSGANLAQSLEMLADYSAKVRDWDGVLAALEESVAVTRKLAEAEPETFLLPLSARLLRLSTALYASGNFAGAIIAVREAAGLCRRLVAERPDAVGHDLVDALKHLSCALAVTGDPKAALAIMREAVTEHRKLAASLGSDELGRLAWSLGLLGMRLRLAGDIPGARAATAEAIALLGEGDSAPETVFTYLCREYECLTGPPP